jgi:hypothetical protein
MTDRDADAEKLAGAMGWKLLPATAERRCAMFAPVGIPIPAPDAPLGEQLAFVGRLAEQLATGFGEGHGLFGIDRRFDGWDDAGWCVTFRGVNGAEAKAEAPDLVHATIRAALAAKGAT